MHLVALTCALLALPACHRKKNLDGRLDDMQQLVNDTCACKMNPDCLKYQQRAYIAWSMRNDSTDNVRATPDQRERYGRLYMELGVCQGSRSSGSGQ